MGEAAQPRRSRMQLWLLAGVFFAPLAVSFLLYYGSTWRPSGMTNHGRLIDPPRPLPEVALETADGAVTPADLLRRRWSLVYLGDGGCDARCRDTLVTMRQVRLALGEDMDRVQRIFLYSGSPGDREYFVNQHPGLIAVAVDGAGGRDLQAVFHTVDAPGLSVSDRIYVVDPLGNLMMSHSASGAGKELLEDLERLLKLSHIG